MHAGPGPSGTDSHRLESSRCRRFHGNSHTVGERILVPLLLLQMSARLGSSGSVRFSEWPSFALSEPRQPQVVEVSWWHEILCELIPLGQSPRLPREQVLPQVIFLRLSFEIAF